MSDDRRKVRSDDPEIATNLQLAHVADTLDLRALVLADDFGRQVAGVGSAEIGEVLATLAMWAEFNGGSVDEFTLDHLRAHDPEAAPDHVISQPVEFPGQDSRLRLIAFGRSMVASIGVAHAARGIERIHRNAPN